MYIESDKTVLFEWIQMKNNNAISLRTVTEKKVKIKQMGCSSALVRNMFFKINIQLKNSINQKVLKF